MPGPNGSTVVVKKKKTGGTILKVAVGSVGKWEKTFPLLQIL